MALHAHEFVPAVEGVELGGHGQAGGAGFFPVADDEVESEFFFPFDKGVAQQGDEIVADRAVQGVLEVENAGAAVGKHDVAHDKVAVDEDFGLRFDFGQQRV